LIPWLVWFSKHSSPELLEEVKTMDAAIQAADERMVYLSGDEDAIRAYEVRFKAACDLTSMRNGAIREGEAKGTLNIARKMKAIGRPSSEIAEVTGLTPEAIQKL
jgi:hypothetical protein